MHIDAHSIQLCTVIQTMTHYNSFGEWTAAIHNEWSVVFDGSADFCQLHVLAFQHLGYSDVHINS